MQIVRRTIILHLIQLTPVSHVTNISHLIQSTLVSHVTNIWTILMLSSTMVPCVPVAIHIQSVVKPNFLWRLTGTINLSFGEHPRYILSSIANDSGRCQLHSPSCTRHLKLGGLQEYDTQYLHALLEDDDVINCCENTAKLAGYGPHCPCDYVASTWTQSQLCDKYFLLSRYSHILTCLQLIGICYDHVQLQILSSHSGHIAVL